MSTNVGGIPYLVSDTIDGVLHGHHIFAIRIRNRGELQNEFSKRGIGTMIHYPVPPHRSLAYSEMSDQRYEIAEELSDTVLSLPLFVGLSEEQQNVVVDVVNKYGRPA